MMSKTAAASLAMVLTCTPWWLCSTSAAERDKQFQMVLLSFMHSMLQAVCFASAAAAAAAAAAADALLKATAAFCVCVCLCLLWIYRTWIYPYSTRREYQFKAAWRLISSNSMVCFPTGTGKTLIAAVVMYNYYRWFPKVRFTDNGAAHPITLT